jgi:hypothetical protein
MAGREGVVDVLAPSRYARCAMTNAINTSILRRWGAAVLYTLAVLISGAGVLACGAFATYGGYSYYSIGAGGTTIDVFERDELMRDIGIVLAFFAVGTSLWFAATRTRGPRSAS